MEGKLTRACLEDYSRQYFLHVEAFPRYLSAIHSLAENIADRRLILENLNDEEGARGASHPDLWLQFAAGLGVGEAEVRSASSRAGIRNVVDTFFKFSRSSFHEGLGALYAYEHQVPEIADSKIEGLKTRYGIEDSATIEFFSVHKEADVYHRESFERILNVLPAKKKAESEAAAHMAALALWDFLSDVHGRNQFAA
jgi:pyrroloquinoline-quinone synthase